MKLRHKEFLYTATVALQLIFAEPPITPKRAQDILPKDEGRRRQNHANLAKQGLRYQVQNKRRRCRRAAAAALTREGAPQRQAIGR